MRVPPFRMVKSLGWIVGKNVFLMGFSQGSITTATLQPDDPTSAVNARVVEGWACLADGDEYRGVNGPEEELFLTLGGERDPWLSEYVNGGRLRKFPQYEVWKRVGSIPTGTTSKTS
jgi:predicted esterase